MNFSNNSFTKIHIFKILRHVPVPPSKVIVARVHTHILLSLGNNQLQGDGQELDPGLGPLVL